MRVAAAAIIGGLFGASLWFALTSVVAKLDEVHAPLHSALKRKAGKASEAAATVAAMAFGAGVALLVVMAL